jgi:Na+/glutamate symporter
VNGDAVSHQVRFGFKGYWTKETAAQIQSLRLRRKRIASICTFSVLTMAMLGVQVWAASPLWLTVVLVVAIAAFTWRAYKSVTPYGWVCRDNDQPTACDGRTAPRSG